MLPFLQLQARLGRKNPSAADPRGGPGDLRRLGRAGPGPGRRRGGRAAARSPARPSAVARLEGLDLPLAADGGRFALSHLVTVDSVDGLEAAFAEARARRNEGLMVKDPRSEYSPGRRGLGWLKMKKALATLDCVVVGVEVGHGKRHGVLSDYTFAVRDDETGSAGHHRQGVQRPDGRRDRRDDPLVRGPHDHDPRALPGGRALGRRRGRLRRDHALRPATGPASRCGSRGSRACARTSRRPRSTRWRRSPACTRGSSTAPEHLVTASARS